jgi:hypothetical protein
MLVIYEMLVEGESAMMSKRQEAFRADYRARVAPL